MSDGGTIDDDEHLKEIINMYYYDYSKLLKTTRKKLFETCLKEYGIDYEFISEKNFKEALKDPKNHLILYKNKEKTIGFCYYKERNNHIYLEEIHVKKEARGKGIGSKMLNLVEKFAKRKGYKEIILDAHISAVNFYLKKGYKIRKKDKDPNYIVMYKKIN